jgi:NitT/TauT family transport system permease protein
VIELKRVSLIRRVALGPADLVILAGLAAVLYFGISLGATAPERFAGPEISLEPTALPYYALRSLLRMALAYLLSLAFAILYGYAAASSRRAEMILLPMLDVLQSVPILSFMPIVVLTFISLFPGEVSVELASVVLIFTSQAWNLAFSFYQSLTTQPKELREASRTLGLHWWFKFRFLDLPHAAIPLTWNSIMSWAGGWFFLMAAEQFTLGDRDFRLPGLGSYLQTAAAQGNLQAIMWGLAALLTVIVLLDQLLWRPLVAWSERFKLEMTHGDYAHSSWLLRLASRSVLLERLNRSVLEPISEAVDSAMSRISLGTAGSNPGSSLGRLVGSALLLGAVLAFIYGGSQAVVLLSELDLVQWSTILAAAVATLLRVAAAQAISLLWTVPVGIFLGLNRKVAARVLPFIQIAASVPATALFPIILLALLGLPGGLDAATVLLMLMGTQWYILMNVVAGAMAIPEDLQYTAESMGLKGLERWRSFLVPAVFPYLITGMITATGGAWNASIVSEYVDFGGRAVSTFGLGALIASSSATANFPLLLASTLTMVTLVVLINRLLWRRLYVLAEERFRME